RRPRRTSSRVTAPLISAQPRDAKAIEQAVGTVDGLDPVEVGAELGDQGLDVDALRGGAVVLERDERLREEVDGAARSAAPGAEVEGGGELHEALQEAAFLGRRGPPGLLPHLLRAQVAAAVEEAQAAAEGGWGHFRSTRGTAASITRAKCSAGRAAERSSSKSSAGGGAASFASSSSTSRLERPTDARSAALTRASRRASRSRPRTSTSRRSAASSPRERCAPPCS